MTLHTVVLAMVAIVGASIAQALLKHGMHRVGDISPPGGHFLDSMKNVVLEPFVIGGFLLILAVVPMWLAVLARLPLSIASPLVSVGYVVAVGIGVLVFKETLTPLRILGVILILLGVIAVSRSQ